MTAQLLNQPLKKKNLFFLVLFAFVLRAAVMLFFVQPYERYRQPDSMDYHNCAVGITLGTGMHRPDTMEPIFWRTPGYPYFLSWFYNYFGIRDVKFSGNSSTQIAALWVQLIISSFIPWVLVLLAFTLTGSLPLAWLTGIIAALHHGFVLASTFFLTEGLGLIFFFLFLLFLYRAFDKEKNWLVQLILAAVNLGIFTWIRPMGEFVTVVTMITLLLFSTTAWLTRLKKILLFVVLIGVIIFPWYQRNHNLTGSWFFCPMFGPYLNSFITPKIIREVRGFTLEDSIRALYGAGIQETKKMRAVTASTGKFYPKEFGCMRIAWPIVREYPFLTVYFWMKEVAKTSFDLYASQLVACANDTYMFDPLEEFLGEKLALALYKQPMPWPMYVIAWLELLFVILQWLGIFAGSWLFVVWPFIRRRRLTDVQKRLQHLWLITMPLICGLIFMTGGFGYARLRLPIEPLMIILALSFWLAGGLKKKIGKVD